MFTWLNFSANTIETCHQQGWESKIRIRGWIWWAELNTFCRWTVGKRDTYGSTTIALGEDQVNGRFVARHEAFVAIGGGCYHCQKGGGMGQESAYIIASHLRKPCVAFAIIEKWFFTAPQALMNVHTGAVVTK